MSSALMYSSPSLVFSRPRRSSPVKLVGRILQGRLANHGKSKMAAKSPTKAKFSKKWKERRKEVGILLSKFASKQIELSNNFLLRNRWSINFLTIDSLKRGRIARTGLGNRRFLPSLMKFLVKKMGLTRPSYTTWLSSYTERSWHLLNCIWKTTLTVKTPWHRPSVGVAYVRL